MSFWRQVVHVFVGDVRRFWPALVGVGAVTAVHRFERLPLRRMWSLGVPDGLDVLPLFYAAIAVLVVQQHSVINDRGFWNVRPITPGAILTSKLLFIGVFLCVIPVAIQVQWLLDLAGGGNPWPVAADSLLYQGAFLALVALGAAVTRNVVDFLTLALAAWIGVAVASALGGDPPRRLLMEDVEVTREYLLRWAWLGVGIGTLVAHYRMRRAPVAILVGLSLLLSATAAVQYTRVDWVPSPLEPEERTPYAAAEGITFRLASIQATMRTGPRGSERAAVGGILLSEGTGAATLRLRGSRSTVSSPEHAATVTYPSLAGDRAGIAPFPSLDLLNSGGIEGGRHVGSHGRTGSSVPLNVLVAEGDRDEIEGLGNAQSLTLDIDVDVFEPTLGLKLPPAPVALPFAGGILTIERVERAPGAILVEGSYRRPNRALSVRFPQELNICTSSPERATRGPPTTEHRSNTSCPDRGCWNSRS
jgi:hypothetical protein